MNKTLFMLALVSLFSVALVAASSYAAGTAGRSGFMMFNSSDLIGAPVKDSHGELMAVVQEVRVDSGGHAFVVVNHGDYDLCGEGGVDNPIPFEELQVSKTKAGQEKVILKTDMEHLDFAPYLNPAKRFDRQYEASIYEYYGIQPYWIRSGSARAMRKGGFMESNSLNLIGASFKNSNGELLGIVNEILVDSEGHVFAVVNHGADDLYGDGGVNTPVPFEALRFYRTKSRDESLAFKTEQMDREHLDFAPFLDPTKTDNRQYEASIYEYYGLRPYWTENGVSTQ
jgi:ribosomal 30S subunit maturation factor RimM